MSNITRRSMIIGAGAAAVAAASGIKAAQAPGAAGATLASRNVNVDVIVIGAGLSGLSSAMMLEEAGLTVQVIEGRERVGGRVLTRFDLPGNPEVGGSSFGAGYGRVLDMTRRMKLDIVDQLGSFMTRKTALVINRQIMSGSEWAESPLNRLPPELRERMPWEMSRIAMQGKNPLDDSNHWLRESSRPFDISVHDFLSERGVNDEVIRLGFSENPYYGTSAHDISALQYCFNDAWIKSQGKVGPQIYSIKGGNQQLPIEMAKKLQRPVDLGREVLSISTTDIGVEVNCADGSRYRAGRVICSLPYSVLRSIRFNMPFSNPHAVAVANLPYMINTLLFFRAKRPFWEEDGIAPSMWTDGLLGTVSEQRPAEGGEITGITVNPRGNKAAYLDRLPREDAIRRVIDEFVAIRPKARDALECVGYQSWTQDPFSAGDWAVFAPGQITRFGHSLGATEGRLHFCGEHTAVSNRGMEGAMESAERAAIEVISASLA
ncbi:MAG: flavin monoamine oxidase family protein [Congregibacter sp.]